MPLASTVSLPPSPSPTTSGSTSARPTVREVRSAILYSGMWMSYGDAAPYLGYGHARAMANANWDPAAWTHLAKVDGTYLSADVSRNHVFERDNVGLIGLLRAFGYRFPDPKPAAWRLHPPELEMLLGRRPSTAAFRLRMSKRLEVLVRHAESLDADDPAYGFVQGSVDSTRTLLARLYH